MRMQLRRSSTLLLGFAIVALTLVPAGRVSLGSDQAHGQGHGRAQARVEHRVEHRLKRVERRHRRSHPRAERHARSYPRSHARPHARPHRDSHRGNVHTRVRHRGCTEVYRPAHWKIVYQRVRLPGHHERVWVPARFSTHIEFGHEIRVKIASGYWETVYRPGRYKKIRKRVRVPGQFVLRGTCPH